MNHSPFLKWKAHTHAQALPHPIFIYLKNRTVYGLCLLIIHIVDYSKIICIL